FSRTGSITTSKNLEDYLSSKMCEKYFTLSLSAIPRFQELSWAMRNGKVLMKAPTRRQWLNANCWLIPVTKTNHDNFTIETP
ncbi:MAG: hypothetical protein JW786_11905, partial [Desulfobacterales bacterium]|nr:hypothetical protein [Desulfobacterales bacterium]